MCRVCGETKAITKPYVCSDCVNIKHFKCFCCNQKFSYNELTARNLSIRNKYKCKNPQIKQLQCSGCKKHRYLLANYNFQCIKCLNKNNVELAIEKTEKFLTLYYDRKKNYNEKLIIVRNKIQLMFIEVKMIDDAIGECKKLEALFSQLQCLYGELWTVEQKIAGCDAIIESSKTRIIACQVDLQKIHNIHNCYNAVRTFLLCGLRPEIARYMPKQIQREIAFNILAEFFILNI